MASPTSAAPPQAAPTPLPVARAPRRVLSEVSPAALAFHRDAVVGDLHSHALLNMTYLRRDLALRSSGPSFYNPLQNQIDLPRALAGGMDVLTFTTYVPANPFRPGTRDRATFRMMDVFDRFVAGNPGRVAHCRTPADLDRALASGRLAALLAVEGGHALEGRLDHLARFKARGVWYLTLTHFIDNGIAGASMQRSSREVGLTPFGRDVVRELERLGILVDVAHTSDRAFWETLELCRRPVLCSHTGARGMQPWPRNLSDEQIRALAARRGLIGIIATPGYLAAGASWRDGSGLYARAAEYFLERAGEDCVALGTDMDGYILPLADCRDVTALPRLTQAMLDRGIPPSALRKVLGQNLLRLFRETDRPL
ncbi:MAG: membrane dipeptidase [Planctomycetes bacterium]|nr:membrane dipeptidase [Planctomycetota bacterium]